MGILNHCLIVALDGGTEFDLDADALVRLLAAAGLGAVIGFEREAGDQPAGLRTHIAVASGAALFGVISTLGFAEFEARRGDTNINVDVTRVASNVVVGIGFLGAGVVFRRRNSIENLTTAASLWAVAAIGLACGVGDITTALLATTILLISLAVLRPLRDVIRSRFARTSREFHIQLVSEGDPEAVLGQLSELGQPARLAVEKNCGQVILLVTLHGHPDQVQESINVLSSSEQVDSLHEV